MDEPLSNLDAALRVQMRVELKRLHERFGITTVYVTHDQVEAMTMGDRIAIMNDGRLQQADTPEAIYERPANLFVAGFVGSPKMNLAGRRGRERRRRPGAELPADDRRARRRARRRGRGPLLARGRWSASGRRTCDSRATLRPATRRASRASSTSSSRSARRRTSSLTIAGQTLTARFPPRVTVGSGDTVEVALTPVAPPRLRRPERRERAGRRTRRGAGRGRLRRQPDAHAAGSVDRPAGRAYSHNRHVDEQLFKQRKV